jgi:amino acid adenylation domain-containing protein
MNHMDKSTQFFIGLLSSADKLAKFNAGTSKAEMTTIRRNMLAEAGITDADELIELTPEELYTLMLNIYDAQIGIPNGQIAGLGNQTDAAQNERKINRPEDTICTLIARQAQAQPDKAALVDGKRTIDYKHLMRRADVIASELTNRGVVPGSLVCVCMRRSWELVAALLGVLQAGCAYVPVDPAYPRERVQYILEHSRASAAIVDERYCADLCKGVAQLIWLNQVEKPSARSLAARSASDLAYVIYTSGSTGQPKGVAIEHRNVIAMAQAMGQLLRTEELEGVLAATSICFDPSVMEIFGTLSLGGTVILVKDVLGLPALSSANAVKSCIMVPSAMQALLATGWIPGGIRCMVFGGEVLKRSLVDKLFALTGDTRIINVYGPTEDTVFSTAVEIIKDTDTITIGKPVAGSRAYILDPSLNPVPDGEAGELYLAGNKLARGYLHDEVRTRERFIERKSDASIPEQRLYKTGDLCRKTACGAIEFLGRVDQQVKIRGFRIELEEIEAVLESMPGITAAAVAAVEGGLGQKILSAYVVWTSEAVSDADVKAFIAQRLPKYMVPQVVTHLDQLPLLPNRKLDRSALQQCKGQGPAEQRPQAVATRCGAPHMPGEMVQQQEVEAARDLSSLLSIIQREVAFLLDYEKPEHILPYHSFDSQGLDSLSTLEFSCRLNKILNLPVPVEAIYQHATPHALARYIQHNSPLEKLSACSSRSDSDSLGTFQAHIQSSHPTFQAAKASAWSASDKGILVQELTRMVNDLRRNPYSKVLRTGSGTRGTVADAYNDEEQQAIIWTTNLYLGLNRDKQVIEEATKALQQLGTGMGTSAAASGITDLHLQFEKEFAELVGKPGACVFPTGYTANVGVVAGLLGKNDVVVIDQLCHASIVDGARLCGATIRTFQHNNSVDLDAILASETSPYRTVLVVLEGVYSMGEGAAPVAEIVRTAKKYGALVLVDEAWLFR